MRKLIALVVSFILVLTACTPATSPLEEAGDVGVNGTNYITIGFSQIGAESDWRRANTESMKRTFTKEAGYELLVEDGQQKQSNQTMSIRRFIQKGVDYIVLAPVTESGWDPVLEEAEEAGIPVIIIDRMVDVENDDLYTCWVGSDFEEEAYKVTEWLKNFCGEHDIKQKSIHIADIQGTLGASAQIGRTNGLKRAAKRYGWKIVAEVNGDFTQTKGREAVSTILQEYDDINVIYCENDNEALGAIEAIGAAGKTAGTDIAAGEIMVLSFDGINSEARRLLDLGKIACIAECNPDHGPRVKTIIDTIESGKVPDKFSYVSETLYVSDAIGSS